VFAIFSQFPVFRLMRNVYANTHYCASSDIRYICSASHPVTPPIPRPYKMCACSAPSRRKLIGAAELRMPEPVIRRKTAPLPPMSVGSTCANPCVNNMTVCGPPVCGPLPTTAVSIGLDTGTGNRTKNPQTADVGFVIMSVCRTNV
jgi:hypothetical protein